MPSTFFKKLAKLRPGEKITKKGNLRSTPQLMNQESNGKFHPTKPEIEPLPKLNRAARRAAARLSAQNTKPAGVGVVQNKPEGFNFAKAIYTKTLCFFVSHKWQGCFCSVCGKPREHEWQGCTCSVCGKMREHNWNGCQCQTCGQIRNINHAFGRNSFKCVCCGYEVSQEVYGELIKVLRPVKTMGGDAYVKAIEKLGYSRSQSKESGNNSFDSYFASRLGMTSSPFRHYDWEKNNWTISMVYDAQYCRVESLVFGYGNTSLYITLIGSDELSSTL